LSILRTAKGYSKLSLLLLAYVAFFALGMPDGLLGVAWPSMRADFSIPLDSLGILLFAAITGYMTSSFLSGALIARMGVGKLLAVSCSCPSQDIGVFRLCQKFKRMGECQFTLFASWDFPLNDAIPSIKN
jgi:MFS family permease